MTTTTTARTFPTLYRKTKSGSLQYWKASVQQNEITIEYGLLGTDSPQTTVETIKEGKNIGRANATTPEKQAHLEAQARWTKQVERNGYTPDQAKAELGERENTAPVPMLAHSWDKHGHKISFDNKIFVNPKLDGLRSIVYMDDSGKVTMYSRKGNEITSVPHIVKALEGGPRFHVLDGELYNHKFKDNFNHITHLVKQKNPCDGHEDVEFHLFDAVFALGDSEVLELGYADRLTRIQEYMQGQTSPYVVLVDSYQVHSQSDIEAAYDKYANLGYEGVMVRDGSKPYEHTRSYGLLKYKKFEDAEFEIVDVVSGRGRLEGHGIFVCKNAQGGEFSVKLEGDTKRLKEILTNRDKYLGKSVTVQFQGLFKDTSTPRFPVGKGFRWEGDVG